jgi:sialidase-1
MSRPEADLAGNGQAFFSRMTVLPRHERQGQDCQYRTISPVCTARGTVLLFASEKIDDMSDDAKSNVVVRRSTDSGKTWEPLEVLRTDDHPRVKYGCAAAVVDHEVDRVLVFVSKGVVIKSGDIGGQWVEQWRNEHPDEAHALMKELAPHVEPGLFLMASDDDGGSWSEPRPVGHRLWVNNPVTGEERPFSPQWTGIQKQYGCHRGRLILPGRGTSKAQPFDLFAYCHNYIVYSDDHGDTWHPGGLTQNGTGEACVVELADGAVYANSRNESLRCRGFRAWDRSEDGGLKFTASGYDLNLPEPHCQASIARFSGPPGDTSRVLFLNPAMHTDTPSHYWQDGRKNLTLRMSCDECRSWPVSRIVAAGGAGYSGLVVAPDKTILCFYETLREDDDGRLQYTGDIELARLNLPWLLEGRSEKECT